MKTRKKTKRGGTIMEHIVARRSSHKQWGQYRNRITQGEIPTQNPILRQRGRNGRVRDFAYTERTRRNAKQTNGSRRHGLCDIAREKAERKRSLKNETYHLGQYGDTKKAEGERRDGVVVRPRHRTTGAAVCVSRARLHGLR